MIASLRGKVILKSANKAVVEVNGVGYGVSVSLSVLEFLNLEQEVFIHISTIVRENSIELFGFSSEEEKTLFEMLISVSGIGPKTGLAIISGISPVELRDAVVKENVARLTSVHGIGRKTAERVILELKEKLQKHTIVTKPALATAGNQPVSIDEDLISSLVNLGYKDKHAEQIAAKVLDTAPAEITLPEAIKLALKELSK
jgi:holliday junction DNA helicase RuvA